MILPKSSEHYKYTFDPFTEELDIKWFVAKNISSYSFHVQDSFFAWDINGLECEIDYINEKDIQVYICLDMLFNDAFAHWIFESFIYLPYILKCKEKFPNCKLLCKSKKGYKPYFLTHFGFYSNDVVYHVENNNNIAFFPEIVSFCNEADCNEKFKRLVDNLFNLFHTMIQKNQKTIPICFLPRQVKDNHHPRTYECNTIIQYCNQYPENKILNTDNCISLQDQIDIVSKSKICIVTEGSPFLVNPLFMINTKIIVLGDITERQSKEYFKFKYITDVIKKYNEVHFINTYQYNSHGHFDSGFHIDQILEYLIFN